MVLFLCRSTISLKLISFNFVLHAIVLIEIYCHFHFQLMTCTQSQYIIGSVIAIVIAVAAGYCSFSLPVPTVEEPVFELHLNDTVTHLYTSPA